MIPTNRCNILSSTIPGHTFGGCLKVSYPTMAAYLGRLNLVPNLRSQTVTDILNFFWAIIWPYPFLFVMLSKMKMPWNSPFFTSSPIFDPKKMIDSLRGQVKPNERLVSGAHSCAITSGVARVCHMAKQWECLGSIETDKNQVVIEEISNYATKHKRILGPTNI